MHEFGFAEGVLAAVRRRAGGRPVRQIRLRAGVRHRLDEQSMAQAFRFVAQGTEAADAALELIPVPARLTCRSCGQAAETYEPLARCGRCGGAAVDLAGGEDLVLESLTYAGGGAAETACA
jgi:hydrogenase nickel incorporation protein HypA/HybF